MATSSSQDPKLPSPANPARWLALFGPGAVIASLTIGAGELIFSTRAGALFGYRILFVFLLICIAKWVLVFTAARPMVLAGMHPVTRWMALPGVRGWFPSILYLFAVICIPIWVSFHASVVGDLIASLTGTRSVWRGATMHLWGAGVLTAVWALAYSGGYTALERVQLLLVAGLLVSVTVALYLFGPDWSNLLTSIFIPRRLEFAEWAVTSADQRVQEIVSGGVWVEATLYVGAIGGAGFDYLAYVSFLREKNWGASSRETTEASPETHTQWLRAPLIDCTLSFVIVFFFSLVFVASGWLILRPAGQIPGDGNFLDHQSQFVTAVHAWLLPLYYAGAGLAMLGTLYGTLEVAPALYREWLVAHGHRIHSPAVHRGRYRALGWCAGGAFLVLLVSCAHQYDSGLDRPPGLTQLLVPANLFTGVMLCGWICLLHPWTDRTLPPSVRAGWIWTTLNVLFGVSFVALGIKGYLDYGGPLALLIFLATILAGWVFAAVRVRLGVGQRQAR